MTPEYLRTVQLALESRGLEIEPGLSDSEIAGVETDFGFRFPPDTRALLQAFVPRGDEFPDWRRGGQPLIEWFDRPADGIAFDVEENGLWLPIWGERPEDTDDAVEEALRLIAMAPILIPLAGHRYIPSRPIESGNPVFSVVQMDVATVGADLAGWLATDYGVPLPAGARQAAREIEFWSELERLAGEPAAE